MANDWHRTSLRVEPTPEGNVLLSTGRAELALTKDQARELMRALFGALRAAPEKPEPSTNQETKTDGTTQEGC